MAEEVNAQTAAIMAHININNEIEDPERTKRGQVGSHKYKYAPLEGFIGDVRKLMAANGCFLRQYVVFVPQGDTMIKLWRTETVHTSGGTVATDIPYPSNVAKTPQEQGSEITYLRRYGVLNHFNLAQDDDDGEAASRPQSGQERRRETPAARQARQNDHDPSWEGDLKKFMARLNEINMPKVKGKSKYDVLCTFLDAHPSDEMKRPSLLPRSRREGMLKWLSTEAGQDKIWEFFGSPSEPPPDGPPMDTDNPDEWGGPPH